MDLVTTHSQHHQTSHPTRTRGRRRPLVLALLGLALLLAGACGTIAEPKGWAAPDIQDDTLYISLQRGTLSAHRLGAQRDQLWEFPAKDEKVPLVVADGETLSSPRDQKIKFEGMYGDPVITDDGVYVTAYSGHIIALNKDGRPRWVAGLPDRVVGGTLVTEDTVYAGTTKGEVFALTRESGAVRWRRPAGNQVWSTPVRAGTLIVVTAMDGKAYAFDRDGNRPWASDLAGAAIAATPALDGDRLYVGAFDKRMYALSARTGERLWQSSPADNWFWTEILVQGDTLFAGSLGGTVYAFDAGTGEVKWSTKVGKLVRSRPALVDGVLVVGSKDGRLHGLRPESGARVWELRDSSAPDDPAAARGDLYADLLPVKGGVYAATERGRSAGHVYFLDVAQQRVSEVALR